MDDELTKTGQQEQLDGTKPTNEPEPLVKAKAALYLVTGCMVVFTPWILILGNFLGKEIPMEEQIMWFCGAIITGILGISPWALEIFKKRINTLMR